jgi:hypothetical protein
VYRLIAETFAALRQITMQQQNVGTGTAKLLDFTPLMVRNGFPLLGCGRTTCRLDEVLVSAAKTEVLGRRAELESLGVNWGYVLGVERTATHDLYRSAWRLADVLRDDVVTAAGIIHQAEFAFSFCKAYSGPVIREAAGVHYEGLHIDTHPALTDPTDLLRILINVDAVPRRFRYADVTRVELAASGLYSDRTRFHVDHITQEVPLRDVSLPARHGNEVSFLLFWASIIPHVGITEPPGYFLYSFEAVVGSPGVVAAVRL